MSNKNNQSKVIMNNIGGNVIYAKKRDSKDKNNSDIKDNTDNDNKKNE